MKSAKPNLRVTRKQEQILYNIAAKHGINKTQAEEAFILFCTVIANTIDAGIVEDENRLYNVDNFKTISITKFGKFYPLHKKVERRNKMIIEKNLNKNGKLGE